MKVGILGGGISGIAIQHFLKTESEVLEAAPKIGGLCTTIWKDGFGYDIGGHILFTKNQEVSAVVEHTLGENINYCKRFNNILYKGHFVKYPFENGIGGLDSQDRYECLIGYLKNEHTNPPTNLREWCYSTFGNGFAEKYLIPYNEKIWNWPTEKTEMGWVERIPKPPMEDVVKSALGIETEGYLHQLFFKYPKHGGVESLVRALAKPDASISCDYRVSDIRREGAAWRVTDGHSSRLFDRLAVTFPIHEVVKCIADLPAEVYKAVQGLRYNTINVVFVAVNNESLLGRSATYIPDPTVLTHRICCMGYFSKELVQPGTSSLIAEITTNAGDGVHEMSDTQLTERTVDDLDRIGLIRKSDVIVTDVHRSTYGYPVYDLDYRRNVRVMRDYFASVGIDLCGRFAEFEYINSDECIRRAIALANRYNEEAAAKATSMT